MSTTSTISYLGSLRTSAVHVKSNSEISTDAPTDNNGNGELFSPTDLTATSLGSCMLTVMGIAANAHDIPFKYVDCRIRKVMASSPRRISEIYVDLIIRHKWSDTQKERLESVALNCPVAKSLHPSINQIVKFEYSE